METRNLEHALQQPTYTAGMLQSQAYRALSNFMTAELKKFNLSLPEWKLLGHLKEHGFMSPSQIAQLLCIKPPVGSRLLNSLGAKQLIDRAQHATDKRSVRIEVTSKGVRLVNIIEKSLRPHIKQYLVDIKPNDLAIYIKVLAQLANKG